MDVEALSDAAMALGFGSYQSRSDDGDFHFILHTFVENRAEDDIGVDICSVVNNRGRLHFLSRRRGDEVYYMINNNDGGRATHICHVLKAMKLDSAHTSLIHKVRESPPHSHPPQENAIAASPTSWRLRSSRHRRFINKVDLSIRDLVSKLLTKARPALTIREMAKKYGGKLVPNLLSTSSSTHNKNIVGRVVGRGVWE